MFPSQGYNCKPQPFETNKHTARIQTLFAHRAASSHRKKRRHLSKYRLPSAIFRPAEMHHCSYWLWNGRAFRQSVIKTRQKVARCCMVSVGTLMLRRPSAAHGIGPELWKETRKKRKEEGDKKLSFTTLYMFSCDLQFCVS